MPFHDHVSDQYIIDFIDKLDSLSEGDKEKSCVAYDISDPSTGRKQWICFVGEDIYSANTIREIAEIVVEKWDERAATDDASIKLEHI